uniref:Uncharacterized protein n=1 Tax=Panagrolaimus superbus TaxID=310955 RepID=A0A914Y8M5_9BILA
MSGSSNTTPSGKHSKRFVNPETGDILDIPAGYQPAAPEPIAQEAHPTAPVTNGTSVAADPPSTPDAPQPQSTTVTPPPVPVQSPSPRPAEVPRPPSEAPVSSILATFQQQPIEDWRNLELPTESNTSPVMLLKMALLANYTLPQWNQLKTFMVMKNMKPAAQIQK